MLKELRKRDKMTVKIRHIILNGFEERNLAETQ